MAQTGYIDWQRLARSPHWQDTNEGVTFVYAFWMADYGYPRGDAGLAMLRDNGAHPDWFCAGQHVDQVIAAGVGPGDVISPNMVAVFDDNLISRPLLASVCLGSASSTFATAENAAGYWWCADRDLNRKGRRVVKELTGLYLRPPVLLTFLDFAPISQEVPEVFTGQATVVEASGHASP